MAPTLVRSLSRLNTSSLVDLCQQWLNLQDGHSTPYLQSNRSANESEEEDYLFPPAESIAELRKIYRDLRASNADKSHIIDRILEGDWRRGLSLQQLAMVDCAVLEQSDTALRWSALKLTRLENDEALPKGIEERQQRPSKRRRVSEESVSASASASELPTLPSIQPATFVAALKAHISPLVKAHYHLHRLPAPYNLSILRIYISSRAAFAPTAGNIPRRSGGAGAGHATATDPSRVIYIALPESCPYVYVSLSNGPGSSKKSKKGEKGSAAAAAAAAAYAPMDLASMKRCILEAIPKAFSRPQERWALEPTKLTAKSLNALCALRGNGRPGTAGGAYARFSECDGNTSSQDRVLVLLGGQDEGEKRRDDDDDANANANHGSQDEVDVRFGPMARSQPQQPQQPQQQQPQPQPQIQPHASLDRFHVRINDLLRPPGDARDSTNAAPINLSFTGADVFLGLKQLASLNDEHRYVDLHKLPSWMTGEMGVSMMTV